MNPHPTTAEWELQERKECGWGRDRRGNGPAARASPSHWATRNARQARVPLAWPYQSKPIIWCENANLLSARPSCQRFLWFSTEACICLVSPHSIRLGLIRATGHRAAVNTTSMADWDPIKVAAPVRGRPGMLPRVPDLGCCPPVPKWWDGVAAVPRHPGPSRQICERRLSSVAVAAGSSSTVGCRSATASVPTDIPYLPRYLYRT